ncbi:hypothetical protein WA026_006213 [Henosepilachna vigintioctopunctata]|uniref:Uncharacterized protein n=1 Tax=Henosepilachna vigintioctopunctata TaxID=420089 RepID=A0AAW1TPY0_9CUCU
MVNNEFIVKELAISNGTQIYHFIFKPKTDFSMLSMKDKRTVEYLENNHHGIKYNDGFVDYKELDDIIEKISKDIDIVYVSGYQKYDFLSKLLEGKHTEVVNVENQGLSQLKLHRDYPQCMAHKDNFQMCSLVNCKRIWKCVKNFHVLTNITNLDKWDNLVFKNQQRFCNSKCTPKHISVNKCP